MKKLNKILCVIISSLFLSSAFCEELNLEQNNHVFNRNSALQLLDLCTQHTSKLTEEKFKSFGFETILQKNYRKKNQINHKSAYSIGKGNVKINGKNTQAYIVVIRGTDGEEWYSNFNVNSAKNDDVHFVQSFLFSAEDILLDLNKIVSDKNSVIVVVGHSRGAGIANLLGLLLNSVYDEKNIYVYTFATPSTIRNLENLNDKNIFNLINESDVVTYVPPVQWGFTRAGTDILLKDDSGKGDEIKSTISQLAENCSSLEEYYNSRIDLSEYGLENCSFTMYEITMMIGTELSKLTANDEGDFSSTTGNSTANEEFISDLLKEHMRDSYKEKIKKLK